MTKTDFWLKVVFFLIYTTLNACSEEFVQKNSRLILVKVEKEKIEELGK